MLIRYAAVCLHHANLEMSQRPLVPMVDEILTLFHLCVNRIVAHNTFELNTLDGCIAYAKYQTDS
jgi:hypothetical protein